MRDSEIWEVTVFDNWSSSLTGSSSTPCKILPRFNVTEGSVLLQLYTHCALVYQKTLVNSNISSDRTPLADTLEHELKFCLNSTHQCLT